MGNCMSGPAKAAEDPPIDDIRAPPSRLAALRNQEFTVKDVTSELRQAGLESSELIVCIDFTKSNEVNGKCFGGKSLHDMAGGSNPYSMVLTALARALADFDDDEKIAAYGFGDSVSRDHSLVHLVPGNKVPSCLKTVLEGYSQVLPSVKLSGPTTFAPAINKAMELVWDSNGAYHILVLIADGQVVPGECMEKTKKAIVQASKYPLSIIMVGVGDGPWGDMKRFDDELPAREWDNFQFCCFTDIYAKGVQENWSAEKLEAEFALSALMEIPEHYGEVCRRGLLGKVPKDRPPEAKVLDLQGISFAPNPSAGYPLDTTV